MASAQLLLRLNLLKMASFDILLDDQCSGVMPRFAPSSMYQPSDIVTCIFIMYAYSRAWFVEHTKAAGIGTLHKSGCRLATCSPENMYATQQGPAWDPAVNCGRQAGRDNNTTW